MPPDAFTFDTSGPARDADRDRRRRHAVRPAGRRGGLAVPAGLPADRRSTSARPGSWCWASCSCCWSASCAAASIGGLVDLYRLVAGRSGAGAERRSRSAGERAAPPARAGTRRIAGAAIAAAPRAMPARSCRRPASPSATAAWSPTATSTSPSTAASCAASSARTARARATFFKMLTCEVPPTAGHDRVRRARHHRHGRHRRLPARPDQELPGQPALHAADGAREPDDRRARRTARQVPARPVPQPRPASRASTSRSSTRSRWSTSTRRRRHAGVRARLWREAAARDRPCARHLAEPAAARRAARRHEPARARRDGQAAEVDQPAAAP